MDSLELLAREDEFKRLNKQLEKKTESLMKEIEHAMQKQDIFSEFNTNLHLKQYNTKKHFCDAQNHAKPPQRAETSTKKFKNGTQSAPNNEKNPNFTPEKGLKRVEYGNGTHEGKNSQCVNDNCTNCAKKVVCEFCTNTTKITENLEFLYAFVSVNVKDNVLPPSFLKDRVTIENVCKFLSSKTKLMQEQIDKLQNTINKKTSQCEAHLTQLAELESERMSLLNRTNSMKAGSAELRAKCMVLQNRLDEKDKLYKEQRSEIDKLSSDLKRLKSKNVSLEARCATQEDAIDDLKQQLEAAKRAEKEFRDSSRSLSASNQTAIARLESQMKSITTRIERQSALIDNLRKQNALLSTDGVLKALEKDYTTFLTQDC